MSSPLERNYHHETKSTDQPSSDTEDANYVTILQRWKQTALHNKALVLTGVIVAFGTLFYVGVAIFQVCMMRKASDVASFQTDKLIHHADRIAKSLEEAGERNKAALDASIEVARADQRAWLGIMQLSWLPHCLRETRLTSL